MDQERLRKKRWRKELRRRKLRREKARFLKMPGKTMQDWDKHREAARLKQSKRKSKRKE